MLHRRYIYICNDSVKCVYQNSTNGFDTITHQQQSLRPLYRHASTLQLSSFVSTFSYRYRGVIGSSSLGCCLLSIFQSSSFTSGSQPVTTHTGTGSGSTPVLGGSILFISTGTTKLPVCSPPKTNVIDRTGNTKTERIVGILLEGGQRSVGVWSYFVVSYTARRHLERIDGGNFVALLMDKYLTWRSDLW